MCCIDGQENKYSCVSNDSFIFVISKQTNSNTLSEFYITHQCEIQATLLPRLIMKLTANADI
jgi:hypothetical protein